MFKMFVIQRRPAAMLRLNCCAPVSRSFSLSPVASHNESNNDATKSVAAESGSSSSSTTLLNRHQQNQQNIQKTIEALQHRINTNPTKLEKTLEMLKNSESPQSSDIKPHLSHFKFPLINFVLFASTIYYLLNYIREYLDFQETQQEYVVQVDELYDKFIQLESELHARQQQKQNQAASGSIWRYFRFF